MLNKLINENSPYLLQHKDNPVNWPPWNSQSLEIAKNKKKPIFLSIGYSAFHWCHVIAHGCLKDIEIAAIMNSYFINIKYCERINNTGITLFET